MGGIGIKRLYQLLALLVLPLLIGVFGPKQVSAAIHSECAGTTLPAKNTLEVTNCSENNGSGGLVYNLRIIKCTENPGVDLVLKSATLVIKSSADGSEITKSFDFGNIEMGNDDIERNITLDSGLLSSQLTLSTGNTTVIEISAGAVIVSTGGLGGTSTLGLSSSPTCSYSQDICDDDVGSAECNPANVNCIGNSGKQTWCADGVCSPLDCPVTCGVVGEC